MYLMAAVPMYGSSSSSKQGCGRRSAGGPECRTSNVAGGSNCGTMVDFELLEIDENDNSFPWGLIHHNELAHMLNNGLGKTMVIDSRSFLEYNTSNIHQSVNVCCSKLVKRRLQQDKVHVLDLLNQTCNIGADASWDVIVYDQCTEDPSQLTSDNFVQVLLHKLSTTFNSVAFLKGGFLTFQASHPSLTENKSSSHRCSTLTSLSQPCMPVSNIGPTRILPFLYLGSQQDSLNQEVAQVNGITYILNVSKTCPRPPYILEGHFHRIPVNDNYCEKLLPYFSEAFQFLDKVREANGCVLVHCLGGVSRSATLAIAYIMRYMKMSSDEAYRYVKDKRPTISPNFNFLGQLLEYEKVIRREEQVEVARREAVRASMLEEGLSGELERASPGSMDLHTTSPSSPGPRSAHRTFVLDSFSSQTFQSLKTSASYIRRNLPQEYPNFGLSSTDDLSRQSTPFTRVTSLGLKQDLTPRRCGLSSDDPPFTRPSSEFCPFAGPTPESSPLSDPSQQFGSYSKTACFSAGHYSHKATTLHQDPCNVEEGMVPFCDNLRGRDVLHSTQSPVCPITGFPSPAGARQDFPESTCSVTGFPGPGHNGSSDIQALSTRDLVDPSGPVSHTVQETNFKDNLTYHDHFKSSNKLSNNVLPSSESRTTEAGGPDPSTLLVQQKEQPKSRQGFSFSSMLSNFKWKSRPPTLPLGSPVGPLKDVGRLLKKQGVENGGGDARLQLTPVSEAVETCDLVVSEEPVVGASDPISDPIPKVVCHEKMEESVETCVSNVGDSGSRLSNATTITMASTQINHSASASSSSSDYMCTRKSASLRLSAKNFTLALSSPTSDFTSMFASSSSSLKPLSPSDSNKRKGGTVVSSSDKQARTEESRHHLTPPRTLSIVPCTASTLKQKTSAKRSFVLPLSSPTSAMARLNFASPTDMLADDQSMAADKDVLLADGDIFQSGEISSYMECDKSWDFKRVAKSCSENNLYIREGIQESSSSSSSVTIKTAQHLEENTFVTHFTSEKQLMDSCAESPSQLSSSSTSSVLVSTMSSSSVCSEMSSSDVSSSSVNLQGFRELPTTSLDKLSFTPCYTRDIVQDLKRRDAAGLATEDQGVLPNEGNPRSSALDSPMSISSGSSAPSIASSTLSPVDSAMTNPFSSGTTNSFIEGMGNSTSAFPFSQSETCPPSYLPDVNSLQGTPDSALSPSEFILSPSSMPQATLAPSLPTFSSSIYYSSSSSMEPLSPMSLSDCSSCSPKWSPKRNSISSPLRSSISSPISSLSSPMVSSPSFSPLVTSPTCSSSYLASAASSTSCCSVTKVVRRDKSKRVMDRPNSIAFSSYPTCELVPNVKNNSDAGCYGQGSQDDASEAYMSVSGKRSRLSVTSESQTPQGRTSWGGYSEREVYNKYREITAAMENAMLRTQVFTPDPSRTGKSEPASFASRKARSLDDFLDSNADEDELMNYRRGSQHWSRYRDQHLLEPYHCGMRSASEPYHSSSSLSSNGSHGSSLEIIQVS
ncbi:unnamed protein product [Lymnaea stagnalis]|uniref:protein-tyrosine-phosphatase n=1 Tax=Lymnaea stagnalis TaxID=6523 RepID=A0AAV2H5R9_LYMST